MKHAPRIAQAMTALCILALPAPAQAQNWNDRYQHSGSGRVTNGYMLRTAWMRAGPDSDYPAVQRINRNAQVSVYGCLRDWSWCDVAYRRDRGWVPGRDIAANYQGRRRGLNLIAPQLGIIILSFSFGGYWDEHYRDRSFYRERDTWQRRYEQNYRPVWGPREQRSAPQMQPRPQMQPQHAEPQRVPQQPQRAAPPQLDQQPRQRPNPPQAPTRPNVTPSARPSMQQHAPAAQPSMQQHAPAAPAARQRAPVKPHGPATKQPDKQDKKARPDNQGKGQDQGQGPGRPE